MFQTLFFFNLKFFIEDMSLKMLSMTTLRKTRQTQIFLALLKFRSKLYINEGCADRAESNGDKQV